jgi:hypothetical protein
MTGRVEVECGRGVERGTLRVGKREEKANFAWR